MRKKNNCGWLVIFMMLIAAPALVSARLAVMSIDLGGEYMKIAIVKPGVPMEIVLNKESSRKTPTLVAFRDGERQFASQAQNTALKHPQVAFGYLMQIIGRHFEDPQVQLYRQRFPYYEMLKDEERGTVLFKVNNDRIYSPEELLGMILDKAKEYAQDFAEQEIKDAVITVPPFYNQAERRAVITSANLVGINVLQLMSDNAAVALNYGVFRRKNFNATTQYYMFYDMGSTSTTATVVAYNVVKTKEGTIMESNPQLTIKGVGFDRTLGGLELTLRLRAHLAKLFNEQKKTTLKVEENDRAMAKLLKEAERVKKVLSANTDHYAQIENLLDEKDFRAAVSRSDLERLTSDLMDRVVQPIEEALKVSDITLPEITDVILMGGGTRLPQVQELLLKFLGRTELGKSINTDEAAAMGAVYQAAYLGKGFKVKKFGVREGNIYPINVEFERQKHDETEDNEERSKMIKRTLFGRMNPYPQRKVMTFNKHLKDFSFNVMYGGLEFLTEDDRKSFGSLLISQYKLLGVEEALNKNKDKAEPRGIKAHFQMDGSGILTLDRVESVFEKNDTGEQAEKSTWSKLGSAIGGFFTGGSSDDEPKVEESQEPPTEGAGASGGEDTSATRKDAKTGAADGDDDGGSEEIAEEGSSTKADGTSKDDADQEGAGETDGKKEEAGDEDAGQESKKDNEGESSKTKEAKKPEENGEKESAEKDKADSPAEKTDEADKKDKESTDKSPKVINIKEVITTEEQILDVKEMSEEKWNAAKKRLSDLRKQDKEKAELEKAKNELESYIFDMQDKLTQGPHEKCTTEEEREKLNTKLSEASDWLYEQSEEAKKSDFKEKLKALKDTSRDVSKRVYEMEERPKALDALKIALNQTTVFLQTIRNLTDLEDPIFTPVEMETLEKLINETTQWRNDIVKVQKKLKPYQNPVLLAEDIGMKIAALDREMRYLINKAKNYKPKPKPKEEKKKVDENATKSSDNATEPTVDVPEEESQEDVPSAETPATGEGEEEETVTGTTEDSAATPEKSSSGKRRPKKKTETTEETEDILELEADTETRDKDTESHNEL